ncbi:MAG: phosphate acyltransferase, partial [Muribaculaceae bacterium]
MAHKQRIVLAEGTEHRTLTAANQLIADGVADIILVGNPDEINTEATKLNLAHISGATIVNPQDPKVLEKYAQIFYELRKSKGVTIEDARSIASNP